MNITHTEYNKRATINGVLLPDIRVSDQFVKNYVAASPFFEGLGGTEVTTQTRDGSITVESTSPDRKESRTVLFTPIPGKEKEQP